LEQHHDKQEGETLLKNQLGLAISHQRLVVKLKKEDRALVFSKTGNYSGKGT
jgi:hypothetical protein